MCHKNYVILLFCYISTVLGMEGKLPLAEQLQKDMKKIEVVNVQDLPGYYKSAVQAYRYLQDERMKWAEKIDKIKEIIASPVDPNEKNVMLFFSYYAYERQKHPAKEKSLVIEAVQKSRKDVLQFLHTIKVPLKTTTHEQAALFACIEKIYMHKYYEKTSYDNSIFDFLLHAGASVECASDILERQPLFKALIFEDINSATKLITVGKVDPDKKYITYGNGHHPMCKMSIRQYFIQGSFNCYSKSLQLLESITEKKASC